VKFDKTGKFLMAWARGRKWQGDAAKLLQYRARHRHRQPAPLYINDRGNRRIQVFDENGSSSISGISATDHRDRITST